LEHARRAHYSLIHRTPGVCGVQTARLPSRPFADAVHARKEQCRDTHTHARTPLQLLQPREVVVVKASPHPRARLRVAAELRRAQRRRHWRAPLGCRDHSPDLPRRRRPALPQAAAGEGRRGSRSAAGRALRAWRAVANATAGRVGRLARTRVNDSREDSNKQMILKPVDGCQYAHIKERQYKR
jgi:hypothetical protein